MITPGQLATARAAQENMLTDSCVIGTLTTGSVDEATGELTPGMVKAWSGPCSVRPQRGRVVEDGGKITVDAGVVVAVPVEGSEAVKSGMVVEVTSAVYDGGLAGMRFRLVEPAAGTLLTLRRFNAEVMP